MISEIYETGRTDYHIIHIQELRKLQKFNSDKLYNNPYSCACSKKWHGWGTWPILLL